MKIERIIREPRGSVVTMGGESYHFKPIEDGGPHVADVDNQDHAKVLLRITEGYRPFGDDARKAAAAVIPPKPDDEEITAAIAAAAREEAKKAAASATEAGTTPQPTEQADTPNPPTAAPAEGGEDQKTEAEAELSKLDDAALRKAFEDEVGRKAHPRMLAETMIAQIAAAREEAKN